MTKTSAPSRPIILNVYSKSGSIVNAIEVANGKYLIGSGEDCDILCEGVSSVSRHHAELVISDGTATLRDLSSAAGTMLNSKIVQEARVYNGDIIQLGSMKFSLELPETSPEGQRKAYVAPDDKSAGDFGLGLQCLAAASRAIRQEVGKIIVGQEEIVEGILVALLSQGHCILVGVPGLAKTAIVCTFAKILGMATQRIQFTPDLMPSDIIGNEMLKKSADGTPELEFCQGPVFTQLLLADEINRTPPKTQAALLEAMQEHQVTVAMKSYHLPLPFCVIATQNPIEQEGTYPLPEAQLDRFMLCLNLDYPAYADEVSVIVRTTTGEQPKCQRIVQQTDILRFQDTVRQVGVPREQVEYAVSLVRATRPRSPESAKAGVSELIDWGAGPRAGQAMIRGAKALAALEGRPAVALEDIRKMVLPVLRHRICCNYKARAEGMNEDQIVRRILEQVAKA